MDNERIERMRKALAVKKLDALIVRLPENVTMLGGYYPLTGMNFLAFPGAGEPRLLVPESEKDEASAGWWKNIELFPFGVLKSDSPNVYLEKFLQAIGSGIGRTWKRIGFEGSFESVAPALLAGECHCPTQVTFDVYRKAFAGAELVDCTELLHNERGIKTDTEIDKLALANSVAACGLDAFRKRLAPGMTEAEIAGLVVAAIMKEGTAKTEAQRVNAFAQVSSGPEHTAKAWRACVISSDRKIEDGDLVVLELGVVADGFWADNTRTHAAGSPDKKIEKYFSVVAEAQGAARLAVGPGVKGSAIDKAARGIIEEAGLGEYFIHVTGHGVGFRYHEPIPLIHPDSDEVLEPGMVFSVEPGIYVPGVGGMRIEDNLAIRGDQVLTLTNSPRALR